jgi:hypothetical protein
MATIAQVLVLRLQEVLLRLAPKETSYIEHHLRFWSEFAILQVRLEIAFE